MFRKSILKLLLTCLVLTSSLAFSVFKVKVKLNYLGEIISAIVTIPDIAGIPKNANPGSHILPPETYLRLVESVRQQLERNEEIALINAKMPEVTEQFRTVMSFLPSGYRSAMLYDIASAFINKHTSYIPNLELLPGDLPETLEDRRRPPPPPPPIPDRLRSQTKIGSKREGGPFTAAGTGPERARTKPRHPPATTQARAVGVARRAPVSIGDLAKLAFGKDYLKYFANKTLSLYSMGTKNNFFYDSRTREDFDAHADAFRPILGETKFEQKKHKFIHGETVATLARHADGKEYINHFRVNGPGTNYDFQRYLRYANHGAQYSSFEGNALGRGLYHRVKNLALLTRARMGQLRLTKKFLREEINPLLQVQLFLINDISKGNSFKINRVNTIGWSRGAAALIMFSNELNRVDPTRGDLGNRVYQGMITPEQLQINILAIDPVPGPAIVGASHAFARAAQAATAAAAYDRKATSLSNLVRHYFGFYAEDFRGVGFDAVVPYHSHRELTKRIFKLPGGHGTVAGGCNSVSKGGPETVSHGLCLVGQFVRLKILHFLHLNGSNIAMGRAFFNSSLLTANKHLQLYNEINHFKRQSPAILEKIAATASTYFTTGGALSLPGNLYRNTHIHPSFGEARLTRHMITNSSYWNHAMGAIPDFFSTRPGVFVNAEHQELEFEHNPNFLVPDAVAMLEPVTWDKSIGTAFETFKKLITGQDKRIYFFNNTRQKIRIFF